MTVATIDVHAHVLVSEADRLAEGHAGAAAARAFNTETFGEASTRVNHEQFEKLAPALTDLGARLAAMDRARVDIQLVSPLSPHHDDWAEPELARRIARAVNERTAEVCAAAPERLVGVGQAPLQHPDLAVEQLTHLVTQLGLRGVVITTTAGDRKPPSAHLRMIFFDSLVYQPGALESAPAPAVAVVWRWPWRGRHSSRYPRVSRRQVPPPWPSRWSSSAGWGWRWPVHSFPTPSTSRPSGASPRACMGC